MADEPNKTPGQIQSEADKRKADAAARGAGSGANAVRERHKSPGDKKEGELPEGFLPEGKSASDYEAKNYNPESEFPEGDASKGKPDFQEIAKGCPGTQPIAMRDHRAYLVSQAEKNQRANDEVQAKAVEATAATAGGPAAGLLLDPDFQRDTSVESALAEVNMHSQEYVDDFRARRAKEAKQSEGRRRAVEAATT